MYWELSYKTKFKHNIAHNVSFIPQETQSGWTLNLLDIWNEHREYKN